jgi:hypothetical protein
MRRLALIGGAALALAGLGNAATATGPSLRVASMKPFVVKGSHFRAREGVLVTLTVKRERSSRRVRTTTTGAFTADFGTVPVDRCSSFVVRAIGSSGDGTSLKHLPLPGCLPARSP